MAGNFNDGSTAVKVQYGPAWWFLDQKTGMEKHIRDLAALGLLRRFIGMVTDSRSFLSYPGMNISDDWCAITSAKR